MSSVQHEGNGGPTAGSAPEAEGLHTYSYGVMSVAMPGWSSPVGQAKDVSVAYPLVEKLPGGELHWKAVTAKRVVLSHAAHLVQLQGLPISRFFLASNLQAGSFCLEGPLYLLYGKMPPPWAAPQVITDVILGVPVSMPQDTTLTEMLSSMVEYVRRTIGAPALVDVVTHS